MKPTKEMLKEYKAIAKASKRNMKDCIKAHLVAYCPKFQGHEDRLDECIIYVVECAKEILDNRPGEVADDACYKMARDFFNDELWEKDAKAAEHKKLVSAAENATATKKNAEKNLDEAGKDYRKAKQDEKKAWKDLDKFNREAGIAAETAPQAPDLQMTEPTPDPEPETPAQAQETKTAPKPEPGQCSLFDIAGFANA